MSATSSAAPSTARAEILATFVPSLVVDRMAAARGKLELPHGDRFPAAVLFADISGFTALTERLAQKGPAGVEELTRLLNAYFERLVDGIIDHGGSVVKFAGDALLALWPCPAPEALPGAVVRAARSGLDVQVALKEFAASAENPLALKVCIGAGDVVTAHLGGVRERREFLVAGAPLAQVGAANSLAKPGDVVLAPESVLAARDRLVGKPADGGALKLESIRDAPAPVPLARAPVAPETGEALLSYIPAAIRTRLDAGQTSWLAELRRMTILFVNLAGLDHRTPLPQAQALLCALQTAIYRYEGSVNKLSVDDKGATLIVAFGLPPLAHEDDPARGVQAALAIEEKLRELGQACAIGVTTGRAFCCIIGGARRREYTIMGDVVNLAARLMQAAKGGVLCDAATQQPASARLAFDELPAITVKGKAAPIAIYRPRGVAETSSVRRLRRRLVGREPEHAALATALGQRGAGGPPAAIVLEGEAGIGKSALLASVVERATSIGFQVLSAAGDSIEKTTAYHAWRSILRRAMQLEQAPPTPEGQRAAVEAFLAADRDLPPLAPLLGEPLGLEVADNEITQEMTGEARADNTRRLLAGILRIAAGRAPTLLAVEDAQWLDSASWGALAAVARAGVPLLTVLATRPPAEAVLPDYRRFQESPGTRLIRLGALAPEPAIDVACRRLGARSLAAPVAALIRDKAHGNPFYCEELADALRATGRVEVVDGECRPAGGASALETVGLPDTIEGLITSRIDRLSPANQLALKTASVIGRSFAVRTLREIYPVEAERGRLDDALEALRAAGITAPDPAAGEPTHAFAETTTREVVYNLMSFAQRRELHRALAAWYERTCADDLAPHYPVLAHHWRTAEDDAKAIDYLARAGEQALRSFANREAVAFFSQAIALAERTPGRDPLELGRWERQLGDAVYALGDIGCAGEHLRRSLALIGHAAPLGGILVVVWLIGQVLRQVLHRLWPSRSIGRAEGQERARALEAARAHERLSQVYFFSNKSTHAANAALSNLNIAELAGPSPELASAYANASMAVSVIPADGLCQSYVRRGLDMAARVRRLATRAYVLELTALTHTSAGRFDQARLQLGEGAELANRIGDRRRFEECTSNQAVAIFYMADFPASAAAFAAVHASASARGDAQATGWGLLGQARVKLALGQTHEAVVLVEEARAALERRQLKADVASVVEALGLLGRAQIRREEWRAARENADVILATYEPVRPGIYYAEHTYAAASEIYLALAARAPAGPERDELLALAWRAVKMQRAFAGIFPMGVPSYNLDLGIYLRLTGNPAKAQRALRRSVEAADRLHMPHDRGLAHLELAKSLPAGADRDHHLGRAREVFTVLRAQHGLAGLEEARRAVSG